MKTTVSRLRLLLVLLCACGSGALAGCASTPSAAVAPVPPAAERTARVQSGYDVLVHAYPAGDPEPANFAVAGPGLVLVPVGGGIIAAGFSGWLKEPGSTPIVSVAAGGGTDVYYAERAATDTKVFKLDRKATPEPQFLGALPAGTYLLAYESAALWAWGLNVDGGWEIWRIPHGAEPERLAALKTPVLALVPAGPKAALLAIGSDIVLVRQGAAPALVARTRNLVHGLAVDHDGSVLVSLADAVARLVNKDESVVLATGVHGPLAVHGKTLYVMRRDRNQVIALTR